MTIERGDIYVPLGERVEPQEFPLPPPLPEGTPDVEPADPDDDAPNLDELEGLSTETHQAVASCAGPAQPPANTSGAAAGALDSGTDLDKLGPPVPPRAPDAPPPLAVAQPMRAGDLINLQREDMRRELARWILATLVLVVVGGFATVVFTQVPIDNVIRLVELFVGPVIGVVGAVTGFYYGTSRSGSGNQQPPG